jgi:hypothetical protein
MAERPGQSRFPDAWGCALKIAICIPVYGDTKAKFTQSLANMLVFTLQARIEDAAGKPIPLEIETFMVSCSMLTESRHRLVAEAMAWGADYMLCLDADHTFPDNTLVRLLSHGLPAVGANYARRFAPTAPTAAVNSGEEDELRHLLYTTEEKASAGLVEPVAHLGFGVLLLDMRIFDALQDHAEKAGDGNFLPLFKFEPTENKIGMIGEDVFFFRKLAEAGIAPFVDHGLSWEVGHMFEMILTNRHACSQRDQWAAHQATKSAKFRAKIDEIEDQAEGELAHGK